MFVQKQKLSWRAEARAKLLEARGEGPAWAYRIGGDQAVEPTALAALSLLNGVEDPSQAIARAAGAWLATRQRADGSLGSIVEADAPGWPTAHALLLWNALDEPAFASARNRALDWLLKTRGETLPRDPNAVVSHDTTLVGWPWVAKTHSWLEPTATALLALTNAGRGEHPRAVEASRLIQDRAIAEGGWNYGNSRAFGASLRPQPASTGLALLALAGAREFAPIDMRVVQNATARLRAMLDRTNSPLALGWGALGLRAWRAAPDSIESRLAEAANDCLPRRDCATRLACLSLAGAPNGLDRFGIR